MCGSKEELALGVRSSKLGALLGGSDGGYSGSVSVRADWVDSESKSDSSTRSSTNYEKKRETKKFPSH